MKKLLLLGMAAALAVSAEDKPVKLAALTDAEKLTIREAQVSVLGLQLRMNELQQQLQAAQGLLQSAVADVQKAHACQLTNDLTCAAKKDKP